VTSLDVKIRQGFKSAGIPAELVGELLEAFAEAKRHFFKADLRPSAIEGGRFSEAAFRILEWSTKTTYTPLGTTLAKVPTLINQLENAIGASDSVRMHIPRTLRLIYDIRNKRDIAHLGDGIDPNLQDAKLIISNMEWVLSELVRLFHDVSPAIAQDMIAELVSKDVPLIQVFDGFPRILKQLQASEHLLVLLYWSGVGGATFEQLRSWVRQSMRANLKRTLGGLDRRDLVHCTSSRYVLTHLGEEAVERGKLLEPR
jgi:hypothetical protein